MSRNSIRHRFWFTLLQAYLDIFLTVEQCAFWWVSSFKWRLVIASCVLDKSKLRAHPKSTSRWVVSVHLNLSEPLVLCFRVAVRARWYFETPNYIITNLDCLDLGRLSKRSDLSSLARLVDIDVVLDLFVSNSALSKWPDEVPITSEARISGEFWERGHDDSFQLRWRCRFHCRDGFATTSIVDWSLSRPLILTPSTWRVNSDSIPWPLIT